MFLVKYRRSIIHKFQKFNYRRPMFELIEYLWHLPDDTQNQNDNINPNLLKQHRIKMKELAQEAYLNIENSSQPLFLKFLNFLINDANYLLIEGLLYLEKIKTAQDKLAQDDIDRQGGDQSRYNLENYEVIKFKSGINISNHLLKSYE